MLSNLILGTSQFGLNYGIANTLGKPTYRQICEMLAFAAESGINALDTAAIYGDSEEVIGRALAELGLQDRFVIATKIPRMSDSFSSYTAINECVEEAVTLSLRRLRLESLPICLFHIEANFRYIDALLKMRDKGLVQSIGCSVMNPEATIEILESGLAEFIQIPASVLDHRFLRSGVMNGAQQVEVTLLVRSIYLQGLLLMDEARVPFELAEVLPIRSRLHQLAFQAGMTLEELAMRFALGLPAVSSVVIGVDNLKQLQHNAALAAKGPLEPELQAAIIHTVPTMGDEILLPNQWKQRMPDAVALTR